MRKIVSAAVSVAAAAVLGLSAGIVSAAARPVTAASDPFFAGYTADYGNLGYGVTRMTATWIEPKVVPHGYHNAYAAFYAGFVDVNGTLGGLEAGMAQIGTAADSIGGKPTYYAWYTPAPGRYNGRGCGSCGPVRFRNSVRPGDHMSATAVVRGPLSDHFTLTMTDVRYRKHHRPLRWIRVVHINVPLGPAGLTVGLGSTLQTKLADFGKVRFTGVNVDSRVLGSWAGVGQENYYTDVDGYTHVLATSSALAASGSSFSVTWKRAS